MFFITRYNHTYFSTQNDSNRPRRVLYSFLYPQLPCSIKHVLKSQPYICLLYAFQQKQFILECISQPLLWGRCTASSSCTHGRNATTIVLSGFNPLRDPLIRVHSKLMINILRGIEMISYIYYQEYMIYMKLAGHAQSA